MRWIKIEDPFVPTLEEMILLPKEVNDWLAMDAQNVIVIHCKGGKGRTETMIYTCLIATGMFLTTKHRYVEYFKTVKNGFHGNLPPKRKLKIERIVVHSLHTQRKMSQRSLHWKIIQKTLYWKISKGEMHQQSLHWKVSQKIIQEDISER
ncbi:phosphatidylinositol 3,4,5-trisphosphate 3-phosphatase TPTE2-like isoform X2 [Dipodomys merriami]